MSQSIDESPREMTPPPSDELIPGVSKAKALFLLAAGMSLVLSVYLYFNGSREQGIFVGLWVPSILSAGALLLGRDE